MEKPSFLVSVIFLIGLAGLTISLKFPDLEINIVTASIVTTIVSAAWAVLIFYKMIQKNAKNSDGEIVLHLFVDAKKRKDKTLLMLFLLLAMAAIGTYVAFELKMERVSLKVFNFILLAFLPAQVILLNVVKFLHDDHADGMIEKSQSVGWSLFLGALGIILIELAESLGRDNHWAELVKEIGVAMIVAGLVSFMIELPDYQRYVSVKLGNLLIKKDYLRGLQKNELRKLKFDIDSLLVASGDDIGRPGSYYNYLSAKVDEALLSPYRTSYSHDSTYHCDTSVGPPRMGLVKKTVMLTYKLFMGYGDDKENRIRVPWSIVDDAHKLPDFTVADLHESFDVATLEAHISQLPSTVLQGLIDRLGVDKGEIANDVTAENFVSRLNAAINKSDVASLKGFVSDALTKDGKNRFFSKEAQLLAEHFVDDSYKNSLGRMLLEEIFSGHIVQTSRPRCIGLQELAVVVDLPDRVIREKNGVKGVKSRKFTFQPEDFKLHCDSTAMDVELKIRNLRSISDDADRSPLQLYFEYNVPGGDAFKPDEYAEVKLRYVVWIRTVRGSGFDMYEMSLPTFDPSYRMTFPARTQTAANAFAHVGSSRTVSGGENVVINFDGWILPGHGISVFYYLPDSCIACPACGVVAGAPPSGQPS